MKKFDNEENIDRRQRYFGRANKELLLPKQQNGTAQKENQVVLNNYNSQQSQQNQWQNKQDSRYTSKNNDVVQEKVVVNKKVQFVVSNKIEVVVNEKEEFVLVNKIEDVVVNDSEIEVVFNNNQKEKEINNYQVETVVNIIEVIKNEQDNLEEQNIENQISPDVSELVALKGISQISGISQHNDTQNMSGIQEVSIIQGTPILVSMVVYANNTHSRLTTTPFMKNNIDDLFFTLQKQFTLIPFVSNGYQTPMTYQNLQNCIQNHQIEITAPYY